MTNSNSITCDVQQFVLELEASVPVNRSLNHLQSIEKVVAISVVDLEVVETLLVVGHLGDIFVVNMHTCEVFFDVPRRHAISI